MTHHVLVRWSDIDSYDHVNNVRYFDYLQEARIAFLNSLFGSGDLFGEYPIVLVSQTVDYLRPMVLRHPPYAVDTWVTAIGNTSYTLGSRIADYDNSGGRPPDPRAAQDVLVYAKAVSVLVGVDPVTHAKRLLTETERAALTAHLRD